MKSDLPILVADDEAAVCRVVELLLKREGHSVATCPDGEAALGLLRLCEYAVLVTDLNLPRIDGLRLLRFARAINPGLPVVVMSGEDKSALVVPEPDREGVYFLPKPFKPQDLLSLISVILGSRPVMDRRAG